MKTRFNCISKKILGFSIILIVVTLFTVAINASSSSSNYEVAEAAAWSTRDGLWPINPVDTTGDLWLNSYCNTNWHMYMSDGGSGDNASGSNYVYIDQGTSTGERHGYHQIRVYFGPNLRYAVTQNSFVFHFSANVHAGNPDYNQLSFQLYFYNGGTLVTSSSLNVWGKNSTQGTGSTDSAAYRYIQQTVAAATYDNIIIRMRTDKDSGWANPRHMDLYGNSMKLNIQSSTSYYNAGFLSTGAGGITGTDPNVYFRNQGSLHGTTVAAITDNTWCRTMTSSHTTGSTSGLYSPTGPVITSQSGTAPTMIMDSVTSPAFINGSHTPTAVASAIPSIGAVSVSDIAIPSIIADPTDMITTVPTARESFTAPVVHNATEAASGSAIVLPAFASKEPADAYRWKNPITELGWSALNNNVNWTETSGDGFLWAFKWFRWDIYGSGTIPKDLKAGDSWLGQSDEVVVRFHTNDQDMHIILPPDRRIFWYSDKDSRMEIVGTGRVFIYLMGNNTIDLDGQGFVSTSNYIGTSEREATPRMFFIGIGGNNYVRFKYIRARVALYLPNGRLAPSYPGANTVIFESDTTSHEINGVVVADYMAYLRSGSGLFNCYKAGLPSNITFNGTLSPLSYFLSAPETTNANYNWTVVGTQ